MIGKIHKPYKLILISVFLFIFSFKVFNISDYFYPTTDSLPINLTTLNIIFNKRYDLDNFKKILRKKGLIGITIVNKNNKKIYSKVPIIVGLLNVPAFYLFNKYFGINYLSEKTLLDSDYSQFIGKFTASIYTSLSSVFLFLSLYYFEKKLRKPLIVTLIYTLCTNVFNTASQANWQHGISLMFINLSIFIYIYFMKYQGKKGLNLRSTLPVSFLLALLTQIRISNGIYLVFFIYLLIKEKFIKTTKIIFFIGSFIFFYFLFFLFNKLNNFPYGYANEIFFSLKEISPLIFIKNLISLLVSPNYGLFTFSPILLFIFLVFLNKKLIQKKFIQASIITIFIFILFSSSWWMWTGGKSLNARLLSEANPLFIILLFYVVASIKKVRIFNLVFLLFLLISFYINILTTLFLDISYYDKYPFKVGHKNQIWNAWYIKPPLILYLAKRNIIKIKKVYKKNNNIFVKTLVYRPSFKYKGIIKLFEKEERLIY